MGKLSVKIIEQAIKETDGTLNKVSSILNVKYNTLQYWIRKYNIKYNNKNKINATPKQLWEEYQKLQSIKKVAKVFNCTGEGIRIALKNSDYIINKKNIYSFNKDFFFEESEKLFYWMGFIAADGCVKSIDNKTNNFRYELSIGLSIKDKGHLEKIVNDINYDGKIYNNFIKNSKVNNKWNDTYCSEVKITISKDIFDKFAEFNIVPRKTLIYKFPEWLMGHPMVNHFMRGYFDGDGSWFIGASKITPQIFFSLRGTSEFLKVYRNILEDNGLPKRTTDIRISCGIGVLEYGGNGHACKIRDFLYNNSTVFLERKHNIVKDITVIKKNLILQNNN